MTKGRRPSRRESTMIIVTSASVATIVALSVGVSRWTGQRDSTAHTGASVTAVASPSDTTDYDEDIHSLPSPTGSPADASTMTPPPADPPIDMHTAFETGIFDEGAPPISSSVFVASNHWSGWYEGRPLSVFAGSPGYEHTDDGAVMVMFWQLDGGIAGGLTRVLEGVGELTVVRVTVSDTIELVNEDGVGFIYDLKTRQLHPA